MLRFLSIVWILIGLMLAVWCAKAMYESYQYFHFISGAFKASTIGLIYAMLAIITGLWVWLRKPWGRFLFNVVSVLAILYIIMFVLFHGYLNRPLFYSVIVITLFVVSVLSLISVNGKGCKKDYFTQPSMGADA